jgi:predicted metal-binding transcription factor (methanogenesis marker protein 9)
VFVRTVEIARATVKIGMRRLTYSFTRLAWCCQSNRTCWLSVEDGLGQGHASPEEAC